MVTYNNKHLKTIQALNLCDIITGSSFDIEILVNKLQIDTILMARQWYNS